MEGSCFCMKFRTTPADAEALSYVLTLFGIFRVIALVV